MISTIWILKLGRSAKLEVVSEGIWEEERFKPGLEGWTGLREAWGEHSSEESARIVQGCALRPWDVLPNQSELRMCGK